MWGPEESEHPKYNSQLNKEFYGLCFAHQIIPSTLTWLFHYSKIRAWLMDPMSIGTQIVMQGGNPLLDQSLCSDQYKPVSLGQPMRVGSLD